MKNSIDTTFYLNKINSLTDNSMKTGIVHIVRHLWALYLLQLFKFFSQRLGAGLAQIR
jgi:hypothetical protein